VLPVYGAADLGGWRSPRLAASRNAGLAATWQALAARQPRRAHVSAAHAAAAIMAMNNVYYRFLHLVEDPESRSFRRACGWNVIGSPGIAKADFELLALRYQRSRLRNLCRLA